MLAYDDCEVALSNLSLRTLVLSGVHLRLIPRCVFDMEATLEVLKVDRNGINKIPDAIGRLVNLRVLSLDFQRPRIKTVPGSITSLKKLQVRKSGRVSGNYLQKTIRFG